MIMKGKIFKYTDKDGNDVKAVGFYEDQNPDLVRSKKVALRILDNDLNLKKTEAGEDIKIIKDYSLLTRIGFWS